MHCFVYFGGWKFLLMVVCAVLIKCNCCITLRLALSLLSVQGTWCWWQHLVTQAVQWLTALRHSQVCCLSP